MINVVALHGSDVFGGVNDSKTQSVSSPSCLSHFQPSASNKEED